MTVTPEMIHVALSAFQSGDMDWSSQDEELMRFALEEAMAVAPLSRLLKEARPYVEDRLHRPDGEIVGSVALLLNKISAALAHQAQSEEAQAHDAFLAEFEIFSAENKRREAELTGPAAQSGEAIQSRDADEDNVIVWYGTNGAEWRRKDCRSPKDMKTPSEYMPVGLPTRAQSGETVETPAPQTHLEEHPDDVAVDRFAAAMKAKLAAKRAEGRSGWDDKEDCSQLFLSQFLREHVEKGDPLDVGNFAMMLHQREERIASLLETLQGE